METLFWMVGALLAWFVLGCVVLASIDDKEQRLLAWASNAPFGLYIPAVMAWPIILFLWRYLR